MLRITILNGNPATGSFGLDSYLEELESSLKGKGHRVSHFPLREMDIRYCTGCWGCWVRTPGECVQKDDAALLCEASINSEFLLFSSPVIMGFTSALLKRAMDRLLPLIHPYFEIVEGEVHHRARYEKYPSLGLVLEKSGDTDEEDIGIIADIFSRDALNFKSELRWVRLTSDPAGEVADEISSI